MHPLLDAALASKAASAELLRYAAYWDTRIAASVTALATIVLVTVALVRWFWINPLLRALRELSARLPQQDE